MVPLNRPTRNGDKGELSTPVTRSVFGLLKGSHHDNWSSIYHDESEEVKNKDWEEGSVTFDDLVEATD